MKKITISLVLLFVAFSFVNAQTTATMQGSKYPFAIYKKIRAASAQSRLQPELISVLVKGDIENVRAAVQELGGTYKYTAGDIACVRIPVNKIDALAAKNFVKRIEGSDAKIELLNDKMLLNNDVFLVQQGVNLPQAYNGEGVMVGIIDEGIDFNHRDLRDTLGHSRIRWLWDQRLGINPAYTPEPYGYGQNFTNTQIDNLEAGNPDDQEYSHGTHVTGTAAGNGLAVGNYQGVAPKADIVFVAVNTSGSDNNFLTNLIDAVQYIFNKADSLHEPCAINISLGTYFGSHDALDLQAQAIGNIVSAKNGRFISCAAGNEGHAPIHLQTNVTPDSAFTWLGGYNKTQSLYFQLWADSADLVNVEWLIAADDTGSAYNVRGATAFRLATSQMGDHIDNVYNGINRIGVVETFVDSSEGRYSIECLISPDSAYYHWRFMTRGTGKFDAWGYDFVPAGLPDASTFPLIVKYKAPDINQTICSSFTCSKKLITAGCYSNRNRYTDVNLDQVYDSTIVLGALSSFSSWGPTRDGRIKPEITAAGEWVLSCAAQYDLSTLIPYAPTYVAAGGQHRRGTGTSMASPAVTGTAALYFQKNPNASYQEVKDAIMGCARTDLFTNATSLPNNQWGYGKLDAYKAIHGCNAVGINESDPYSNVFFENYPNPFSQQTNIHYDFSLLNKQGGKAFIIISDAIGRKVRDISLTGREGIVEINRNDIGSGVYFYSLILDGKIIRTNKLVVM